MGTDRLLDAAVVARRYYLDRRRKSEIAAELGLSRFAVARLLDLAHDAGLVRITVDVPADVDLALSDRVREAFGLRRVIVVRPASAAEGDEPSDAVSAHAVGVAAAGVLSDVLRPADVVGLSWGSGVGRVVDAVGDAVAAEVVQLVGGIRPTPLGSRSPGRPSRSGRDLVVDLAGRLGADAVTLDAPLLLESAATADLLRRDPSVAGTIGRFGDVSVAVVGVGSWTPPSSSLADAVTAEERAALTSRGAVADVCGVVLGADGRSVPSTLSDRTIGVDLTTLRSVPTVIAVASGREKGAALAAALRSGVVDVLVTDAAAAVRTLGGGSAEARSPRAR